VKPLSLRLKGFIGIKKGMGLDDVTVNLAGLSGLIAFDGKNGRGKTTILDNLTPYRTLASREGSLAHHVFLRDSSKAFDFELGGHKYETLVKIDSHTGKQEGFVWRDGEPQVSGKATEYDKYIEGLLGSPKLFFQSVFAAQGGGSLADMTTGELKGLFSEFLQLDVLAAYEDTAKQAGKKITRQIETLSTKAETLREKADKANRVSSDLEAANQKVSDLKADIESRRTDLETAEKDLEVTRAAAARAETAWEKVFDLRHQKSKVEEQKGNILTSLAAAEAKAADLEKKKADSNREELQAAYDEATKMIDRLTEEFKVALNEVKATREDIESRRIKQQQHETNVREEIDRIEKELAEKREAYTKPHRDLQAAENEIKALQEDRESERLKSEINILQSRAKKLDMRDEDCKSETCVFIQDALKAKKDLPDMEAKLKDRQAYVETRLKEVEADRAFAEKYLAEITEGGKVLSEKLDGLKQTLREEKERTDSFISDLLRSAWEADTFADKAQKDIDRITKERDEFSRQLADLPRLDVIDAEINAAKEKQAGLIEAATQSQVEIDALTESIKPLEEEVVKAPGAQVLEEKKKAVAWCSDMLHNSQGYLAQVNSQIAVLEYQLKEIASAEDDLAAIEQKQNEFRTELSEWQYIQNACGKNGLQALEIDGTAPLIAGYANELLTETFGPGATVGFRTINDDGKECLDIVVYREDDTDDNGTLLENLSGGQKVWILKALRLALTLVSKAKSGKDIAAALSDEEDGALDAEAAQSFINLYRAFLEAGGFESCIYITHRDEAKALADHVVKFGKGGVKVDSGYSEAA
jgi:DNA repair protein SbcC/Rad50